MLDSYFQNSDVAMTKEKYFEMCELMGYEVVEQDIPVEFDDFPLEAQEALKIYSYLQDNWDYMNGNYIGKNMSGFLDILKILEVDPQDYRTMYELVVSIDKARHSILDQKRKQQKART